jgi:CO/xanthine dehydrogenase FAD-binding subunit
MDRRGDLSIADLFGNGAGGVMDNTLANGERIVSITLSVPLPRERATYRRAISQASAEWPLVAVRVVIDDANSNSFGSQLAGSRRCPCVERVAVSAG